MVSNHPLFKGDSSPTYSLSFLEVGVFSPKTINQIKKNKLIMVQKIAADGGWAYVNLGDKRMALLVFSWGSGWDHVSVSYRNRCCTWEEMCQIKDMFFRDDETVVQYHPAEKAR